MAHPSDPTPDAQLGVPVLALLLCLLALALAYLPGQASVPPIDRDEPRYTQATKQMMETGDYVRIRFQDAPRHKKPVGIHWLQAASAKLSGLGAEAPLWVYRIPSVLGAIAAMILTAWTARAFLPLWPALIVGGLLGATIILGVEARLAKTDAVLLATVVCAQGALARLWLGSRSVGLAALFWIAFAGSILVKGPVGPMVIGLTTLSLGFVRGFGHLKRLRPLLGIVIAAAIALPWYVAIYLATDGAFYAAAVGKDFLGKAASGQEGHWAPPLTHLALFFAIAWPLAPFTLAALWRVWRERTPAVLFAAAWVVPAWVVFEAVPTKLPHYTLPMLPGIALATVATLLAAPVPPKLLRVLSGIALLAVPVGAGVAVLALPVALGMVTGLGDLFAFPIVAGVALAAVAIALAATAAAGIWRGRALLSARVVVPALLAAAIAQGTAWGVVLPSLSPVWISPRLVAAVDGAVACPNPRVVSIGFNEPSMVFLAGTDTALVAPEGAISASLEGPCSVIVTREIFKADLVQAAQDAGVSLTAAGTVDGFNISKGDWLQLSLFVPERIE